MTEESISLMECSKRMNKTSTFIGKAIVNGSFPGSYTINENGVYSFHIPRQAFEEYMVSWKRDPSQELFELVLDAYLKLKERKKNGPAVTGPNVKL